MQAWGPGEIKELRKKLKLSQKAFGSLIGVTGNYVYLLERGGKGPSNTLRLLMDCIERERERERKV